MLGATLVVARLNFATKTGRHKTRPFQLILSLMSDEVAAMGLSNERGSVVVLVAVMLFLIFFCVALVVDIGHIHNVKIELQRAVDAAALAGAQDIPDGSAAVVATAVAMGNANQVDNDAVVIDPAKVEVGWWKTEIIPGETAFDRFTAGGTTINAVKVSVTLNVPHFFFFPIEDSVVTADAIAVYLTINPVFPLAMVACTTSTGESWKLPDMTITGITNFKFAANDLGAWTSLTFSPANATTINDLIVDTEKLDNFNRVIYGKNLDNDGIENTNVDTGIYPYNSNYGGCQSEGLDITCGLGRIANKEIATPDEYPAPPNLNNLNLVSGNYLPTAFDPLTDFGSWKDAGGNRVPGALPRWYNLNNEQGLQNDDYFARILTQDGVLLNSTKLQDGIYSSGAEKPFPLGAGDDRFRSSKDVATGGDLLLCDNKGEKCKPNYPKILQRAGYPQVYLTNGVSNTLIANFLDKIEAQNGTMPCSEEDPPLPASQQALALKAPVIYVGDCDDVKFNPSDTYNYVGLAKFLVTRIWANNNCYFCPDSDLQDESRPGAFQIEGLQIVPVADGEDDQASLTRIYLVE